MRGFKLFILSFVAMFALSAQAVLLTDCKQTIGGHCYSTAEMACFAAGGTTAGTCFIAHAWVATSTRFSPMLISGQFTAVSPAAARSFTCEALRIDGYGTGGIAAQLAYGDASVTVDTAALTNPVYQAGASGYGVVALQAANSGMVTAGEIYLGPSAGFLVPTGKFLYAESAGANVHLTAYCKVN